MSELRVALAGVGNCASALVQGVEWYRKNPSAPGLMTSGAIDGYEVGDIKFVAAFDVNETKVGLDLSSAIHAFPNNTIHICDVPYQDITVVAGPALDGVGPSASRNVHPVSAEENVVEHLRATHTDVLVNFLPVGSEQASQYYAQAAIDARCGFVNAIPVRIARDPVWANKFYEAGLVLIGDDVRSQFGATVLHQTLVSLLGRRGLELLRTYQLNIGGNMDFLNMKDQERLHSKRESKTGAVQNMTNQGRGVSAENIHIGPSDYVPWLTDRKVAMIRLEAAAFGGAPLEMELRLEVWDSPNSAGVVVDAVRLVAGAMDRGERGVLASEAWGLMKAPPGAEFVDVEQREILADVGEGRESSPTAAEPLAAGEEQE